MTKLDVKFRVPMSLLSAVKSDAALFMSPDLRSNDPLRAHGYF